jgi:hypothetical protein
MSECLNVEEVGGRRAAPCSAQRQVARYRRERMRMGCERNAQDGTEVFSWTLLPPRILRLPASRQPHLKMRKKCPRWDGSLLLDSPSASHSPAACVEAAPPEDAKEMPNPRVAVASRRWANGVRKKRNVALYEPRSQETARSSLPDLRLLDLRPLDILPLPAGCNGLSAALAGGQSGRCPRPQCQKPNVAMRDRATLPVAVRQYGAVA